MSITVPTSARAEDGRIHISFLKADYGSGTLHSAADIIGTYTATDSEAAILRHAKAARLENQKGVVIEIRAVNLNRLFTLNLSGMTIKNLGWQPVSESTH